MPPRGVHKLDDGSRAAWRLATLARQTRHATAYTRTTPHYSAHHACTDQGMGGRERACLRERGVARMFYRATVCGMAEAHQCSTACPHSLCASRERKNARRIWNSAFLCGCGRHRSLAIQVGEGWARGLIPRPAWRDRLRSPGLPGGRRPPPLRPCPKLAASSWRQNLQIF